MGDKIICPEFHCKLEANHTGNHECAVVGCAVYEPIATRVQMTIVLKHDIQGVQFTNVPVSRVHAAIALLNDGVTKPAMDRDSLNEWRRTAPYPIEESKGDFTLAELFPDGTYRHNLNYGAYMCTECSALVGDLEAHVTWHNKLLP